MVLWFDIKTHSVNFSKFSYYFSLGLVRVFPYLDKNGKVRGMRSENGDAVKAIGKARMVESEKDERNSSGRNAKTHGDGRAPPPPQPPTKGSAMKKPFLVAREK